MMDSFLKNRIKINAADLQMLPFLFHTFSRLDYAHVNLLASIVDSSEGDSGVLC